MRHLFQESFFYMKWSKRLFHDQIKPFLLHVGLEALSINQFTLNLTQNETTKNHTW